MNSASDVVFGEVCSHTPITKPFGQSDFERIISGEDRIAETATTEAPSDSQMYSSFSTSSGSSGSVSPSVSSFSAAPTVSSGSFVHTLIPMAVPRDVLIPSDSGSGSGGGSRGGGTGGGSGGEDDDFLLGSSTGPTISPTPTQAVIGGSVADDESTE